MITAYYWHLDVKTLQERNKYLEDKIYRLNKELKNKTK